MRYRIRFLQFFFISVIALTPPSSSYALDDAIIAVVNDEVITLKDLRDYIRQTYVSLVAEGVEEQQLKAMMLDLESDGINKLIEDRLILTRAKAIGIDVREQLIDQRLAEIKQRYPSEEVFLDALVKNGANITELRDKILDQLKIKFVVEHEVKSKIFVNPQEVTEFYEQNKDSFQKSERVNLESIYITFLQDKEAARQRAKEALELIGQGTDFLEVAKQYSDTPSVGVVERGQLQPAIEGAVFNLQENEVSPLMEVDTGIYIFRLKGKIPSETAGIKEVKDQIYKFLFTKKFKDSFTQWLQGLRKNAYIDIKQ